MSDARALSLTITGRVQGVGFRAWVLREARRRGLRGWVRNRREGSVEALVIGPATAVETMVGACRRGPVLARVDDIAVEPVVDDDTPDFTERPTV